MTSIWSVKGWIGKVLIYIENPEKTVDSLDTVLAYAANVEKTKKVAIEDEETNSEEAPKDGVGICMQQYVSGINCTPQTARWEMTAVKQRFGKEGGIAAFHGYQSFAEGECTPKMAHEIGVKLAEELWGARFQVLVATHLDKENHLHNHFVINSVSFVDGLRYHRTNQEYQKMRTLSDRLCKDYSLSVIENPVSGKGKHYGEWRAERDGRPTYRNLILSDVDEALSNARTERQFFYFLREKGYTIKFGKDITLRPPGKERGLKLRRNFGEEYTIEAIRRRILENAGERTSQRAILENVSAKRMVSEVAAKRHTTFVVRGSLKRQRRISGLRGLYLHYCYLLGILPRKNPVDKTKLPFLLKEDLRHLEQISRETRLLCHHHIDTAEQLFSYRENVKKQVSDLKAEREKLYRQKRGATGEKREELQGKINELTGKLSERRKEMVLCDGISERSGMMKEKIKIICQETKSEREKEEKRDEYIR